MAPATVEAPTDRQRGIEAREYRRRWNLDLDRAGREIGEAPPPIYPDRQLECIFSLPKFLKTYFPKAFSLDWSPDHLEVIAKIEQSVSTGHFFAQAMPRGSGKTTLVLRSAIWAMLCGYSRYLFLICADAKKAQKILEGIKTELECNELLFEDFPDMIHPIRALERSPLRTKGQTVNGVNTNMIWTADALALPTVEGKLGSGAVIGVGGITGAARGAQHTTSDGTVIRPDLILVDDFQTRESAASPTQCEGRLQTIVGDLAGMVGPGCDLSILVTATVIYQDDAADKLLSRELHPEWYGIRKQMVVKWPKEEDLWDKYLSMRYRAMRQDLSMKPVNQFYIDNREKMDEEHIVSWPQRKRKDEISAIQHAYNLRQQVGEEAFLSEYQNTPKSLQDVEDFHFLSAGEIAQKKVGLKKGQPATETEYVVAGIDVQQDSLWWCVTAWGPRFTGVVIDYGVYPEQKAKRFSRYKLRTTLANVYAGKSVEENVYQGIMDLAKILAERRFTGNDDREHSISRILVDEGFKTDVVYLALRDSPNAAVLMPSRGLPITAHMLPMCDWVIKKGITQRGLNYQISRSAVERHMRGLKFDANFWKTFVQERLATGHGAPGDLSLYGGRKVDHTMFSEHLTAEQPTQTEGRGRRLIEWVMPPSRPDNDWLDALTMSTVGAASLGLVLNDEPILQGRSRYKSLAQRRLEKAAKARS